MKTKKFVALLGVILPVAALPAIAASCGKTEEKKTEEVKPTPAPTPAPTPEPAPAPTPKEGTGSNEGTGNAGSGTTSPNTTPAVAPVTASPAEIAKANAENTKTVNAILNYPQTVLADFSKLITAVSAEIPELDKKVTSIRDEFKKEYDSKKTTKDKSEALALGRKATAELMKAKQLVVDVAREKAQNALNYYSTLSEQDKKAYVSIKNQAEQWLKVNTANDMGNVLFIANKIEKDVQAIKDSKLPAKREKKADDLDEGTEKSSDMKAKKEEKA
ncbi:variable surface lipoprotein [Mycoplasma struthionis]|uniref:Variable surface lipoprotein n=1 Tax=Mycoplasma struthionis TaxID=538220 RepID=A0A502M7S5_9MOLU|nr:variable surface lipoprotein [Mycoplasma struthionis]TPI02331.1 variable surface lipoprotein [Mycoplasma struthionis]